MKCVKNVKTSEIVRVSEESADLKVSSGKWNYCSKSEWKSTTRKKVK